MCTVRWLLQFPSGLKSFNHLPCPCMPWPINAFIVHHVTRPTSQWPSLWYVPLVYTSCAVATLLFYCLLKALILGQHISLMDQSSPVHLSWTFLPPVVLCVMNDYMIVIALHFDIFFLPLGITTMQLFVAASLICILVECVLRCVWDHLAYRVRVLYKNITS